MTKKQTTKKTATAPAEPVNLKAMMEIADQWARPGAKVTIKEDDADEFVERLNKYQKITTALFKDKDLPIEERFKAADLALKIIDLKLSIATGRREVEILPGPGLVCRCSKAKTSEKERRSSL